LDECNNSNYSGSSGPATLIRLENANIVRSSCFVGWVEARNLTIKLIANGQLDLKSFEERRLRIQQKEEQRLQNSAIVYVDNTVDKYKLEGLPQIDCQSRIDLCKARCCKFAFAL